MFCVRPFHRLKSFFVKALFKTNRQTTSHKHAQLLFQDCCLVSPKMLNSPAECNHLKCIHKATGRHNYSQDITHQVHYTMLGLFVPIDRCIIRSWGQRYPRKCLQIFQVVVPKNNFHQSQLLHRLLGPSCKFKYFKGK
jgi:hypothetical protein